MIAAKGYGDGSAFRNAAISLLAENSKCKMQKNLTFGNGCAVLTHADQIVHCNFFCH